MKQHDDRLRLRHMLESATEAIEMVRGKKRADLDKNRMLQFALVRLVEIVGEASTKVSAAGRKKYQNLPWQQAKGMRNRLIHGYDSVDLNILWDTIQSDFPPLVAQLKKALGEESEK
jgi:uncharacterized protein with HEPN domain